MGTIVNDFFKNEHGATSVEYALIMVVIGIGMIISLQSIGVALDSIFTGVSERVESVN